MELAEVKERIDSSAYIFLSSLFKEMPPKAVVSKVLGVERGSGVKVDFSFYDFLIGAIRQWRFSDNVFGTHWHYEKGLRCWGWE